VYSLFRNFILFTAFWCFAIIANAQIGFIENKGQYDEEIAYQAQFSTHLLYLDQEGFSLLMHDEKHWSKLVTEFHDYKNSDYPNDSFTLAFQHVKYVLLGANLSNHTGSHEFSERYNFFIGNDASHWAVDLPKYTKILYKNIYPNIDLEYETIDERFKYNFILNPGADINDIQLKIEGAESVRVTSDRIYVNTRFGEFSEVMPVSYEVASGTKTPIKMNYIQRGDYIGFYTPFFKSKVTTVIDPELIFSTYSGSTADNFGFTATYDDSGALYSGGIVTAPTLIAGGRYPATPGAFDVTYNNGTGGFPCDIAISKYASDGKTLEYATYLGGSSNESPHSLIVDNDFNLLIFGTSSSSNYPTVAGSYDVTINGSSDIIVTKLNRNGSTLLGSTFVGGLSADGLNDNNSTKYFYADDYRGEVNLDLNGNVLIASCTFSSDFPTTPGALQGAKSMDQDGVVFSLSPDLKNLRWSTFFGGSGHDGMYSIDVNSKGQLIVAGGTSSQDLQGTQDAYSPTYNGGTVDGFVSILTADGGQVVRTSYYGTVLYDQVLLAEVDLQDNVYIVGHSTGNIATKGNVYSNTNGKQFFAKFNPDLTVLELATVYGSGGGRPDITINAFLVDECGKIYASGWGSDDQFQSNWSLGNMPISSDAAYKTTNKKDFHIVVLEKDFESLVYGTYFGGNTTGDHVDGGTSRFDKRGIIYQSVCSSCPPGNPSPGNYNDFPTTSGAYAELNLSPRCSNASFKMAVVEPNLKPTTPSPLYTIDIADTVTVTVFDTFELAYQVRDPEGDSVYVNFDIPTDLRADLIEYVDSAAGKPLINARFRMFFTCKNANKTYKIKVHARDIGCPSASENDGEITIIVRDVPVLPPPDVLCLNFINDGTLRIDWEATDSSRYFYRMSLHKIDPNGGKTVLVTTLSQLGGSYVDADVVDPRNREYNYYLVVENICGKLGSQSYNLNSVKESEVPVEATYLKTATVNRRNVEVTFLKSNEVDFGHYEIYRGSRDGKSSMRYITSVFDINDTTYIDSTVNVDAFSYCYQVRVSDNCGHLSTLSNEGCTIVLRGLAINKKEETPRFKFDLHWDDYVTWPTGVVYYELKRSVDTGSLRPIVRVNSPTLDYTDQNLDYDWGGYWYSVIAYEAPGSMNATSRSNDIYLIQPPLVFVPNAITANKDGLNETFRWSDVFVREFEMRLYNRWGEKVFETTDKNAAWDGTYKENETSFSNVYFWVVTYKGWDNFVHHDKGTLTIVR
jgi:gliding motility-associated-like protein